MADQSIYRIGLHAEEGSRGIRDTLLRQRRDVLGAPEPLLTYRKKSEKNSYASRRPADSMRPSVVVAIVVELMVRVFTQLPDCAITCGCFTWV